MPPYRQLSGSGESVSEEVVKMHARIFAPGSRLVAGRKVGICQRNGGCVEIFMDEVVLSEVVVTEVIK